MNIWLFFVLLLLGLAAPAKAQQVGAPALDKIIVEFVDLFNARDLRKLAAHCAEDAVWLPSNTPMIKGHAAIEDAINQRYAGRRGVLKMTGTTSGVSGTLGYVAATYTLTLPSRRWAANFHWPPSR